jgi:hypothetical protein
MNRAGFENVGYQRSVEETLSLRSTNKAGLISDEALVEAIMKIKTAGKKTIMIRDDCVKTAVALARTRGLIEAIYLPILHTLVSTAALPIPWRKAIILALLPRSIGVAID